MDLDKDKKIFLIVALVIIFIVSFFFGTTIEAAKNGNMSTFYNANFRQFIFCPKE